MLLPRSLAETYNEFKEYKMSSFLFLLYALALAVVLLGVLNLMNWILARKEGKQFIGLSAAFSDRVGMKAFAMIFVALVVIACFVVLALNAGHVISI